MATKATVERAKEDYRRLVRQQRQMPVSDQWTMANQIKHAAAVAKVEMEEFALFGK